MLQQTRNKSTFLFFIFWQLCVYGLVKFRHKSLSVSLRKRSCLAWNTAGKMSSRITFTNSGTPSLSDITNLLIWKSAHVQIRLFRLYRFGLQKCKIPIFCSSDWSETFEEKEEAMMLKQRLRRCLMNMIGTHGDEVKRATQTFSCCFYSLRENLWPDAQK